MLSERALNTEAELLLPIELNFLAPVIVPDLVRIGRENDGGYGVPKSLVERAEVLVSLGVNEDWSFDEQCRKLNPGLSIHAYDFTISRKLLVKRLALAMIGVCAGRTPMHILRTRWRVLKSYDAFFTGPVRHFEERVYNRVDLPYDTTLATVFKRTESNNILLKVDIEGCEYRIIDAITQHADRILGLIVEFHDTLPLRPVFIDAVRKLQEHFQIVHLHANNFQGTAADNVPEVLEITFTKRTGDQQGERRALLPVAEIDAPNNPDLPDYKMRFRV